MTLKFESKLKVWFFSGIVERWQVASFVKQDGEGRAVSCAQPWAPAYKRRLLCCDSLLSSKGGLCTTRTKDPSLPHSQALWEHWTFNPWWRPPPCNAATGWSPSSVLPSDADRCTNTPCQACSSAALQLVLPANTSWLWQKVDLKYF